MTLGTGGKTRLKLLEKPLIHPTTLTLYHQRFGWPAGTSSRSRAVTTLTTLLCCRQRITVWVDRHSAPRSRAMVTSEMAQLGPITSVLGVARYNMVDSTKPLKASHRLHAMARSKVLIRSASGVTGVGAAP